METPKNSQEMNENLDLLHHEWPQQYVLTIAERGSVTWYESYATAVRYQREYGGIVINTETADPEWVQRCVDNAMRNIG